MKILSLRDVLILHEHMVKKHGGSSGVRDMHLLQSAINRPFATYGGEDLYPDIFLKSGALIQSIVKNHPFIDGNKRTAFGVTYTFLRRNKIQITAPTWEVVKLMVEVANKNLSVDEIASWLKHNTEGL